ncbi:DgyrCDS14845 [Dimorphilus gyrociliatus]|uniref:DgyrCDS14845 n=1 Tax=Dimorphilus gyrociliatus TaxID=2664684 RepID=A0A7I8WF85_9ANNE|nr:DgyrCDS14845 [Dimorphilus gyrociliatus]
MPVTTYALLLYNSLSVVYALAVNNKGLTPDKDCSQQTGLPVKGVDSGSSVPSTLEATSTPTPLPYNNGCHLLSIAPFEVAYVKESDDDYCPEEKLCEIQPEDEPCPKKVLCVETPKVEPCPDELLYKARDNYDPEEKLYKVQARYEPLPVEQTLSQSQSEDEPCPEFRLCNSQIECNRDKKREDSIIYRSDISADCVSSAEDDSHDISFEIKINKEKNEAEDKLFQLVKNWTDSNDNDLKTFLNDLEDCHRLFKIKDII